MDNKAQLSAELLIIMAAIVAVAIIFVSSISSSAKSFDSKYDSTAKKAATAVGKIK